VRQRREYPNSPTQVGRRLTMKSFINNVFMTFFLVISVAACGQQRDSESGVGPKGDKGEQGEKGDKGDPGQSYDTCATSRECKSGESCNSQGVCVIPGKDGQNGVDGQDGQDGEDGVDFVRCHGDSSCGAGEACNRQGVCVPGQWQCHDNGDCASTEACNSQGICIFDTRECDSNADCQDNNLCNGAESCTDGTCRSGTPKSCDDGNATTIDSCTASTGVCKHDAVPECDSNADCRDENLCNGAETCENGVCKAGQALTCDDGDRLTVDSCVPSTGCKHEEVECVSNTDCQDNNLCNGAESCTDGTCRSGTPKSCDDGNPATVDSCTPSTGVCVNEREPDDQCDGNADCPTGQYCASGVWLCYDIVDSRGRTPRGAPGNNAGPSADGTPDNFDDDGDGYCEVAPCVGSRDMVKYKPSNAPASDTRIALQGGDCDDNPDDDSSSRFTQYAGTDDAFVSDGSMGNNPGAQDYSGDMFDNNCNGVVDSN